MDNESIYRQRYKILAGIIILGVFTVLVLVSSFTGTDNGEYDSFENDTAFVLQDETGNTSVQIEEFAGEEADMEEESSGSVLYHRDKYMKEFIYIGVYKGNVFPERYEEDGDPIMRISSELVPEDGVMDFFIVAKVEQGEEEQIKGNIYVDDDVVEHTGRDLNISWGREWENFRPYSFTKVAPNIYMDSVEGDYLERMIHGSAVSDVNIAVGTFTKEDIEEKDLGNVEVAALMK